MGLLDDRALVGALHQLVDLRAHRALDDAQQVAGVDLGVAALGAADVEGADAALVVGGDRDGVEDLARSRPRLKPLVGEALAGAGRRPCSWAQGQAVMPWAWTPVSVRVPRSEATAVPNSV